MVVAIMLVRQARALSFLRCSTLLCARSYHSDHFSTTDGRFWNRKLHGTEKFFAAMATYGDGYAHITVSTSLIMKPSITSTMLRDSVRNAWIRLRFYAPLIGLRTQQGADEDGHFMTYEASNTYDIAAKWAGETIKWDLEERPFLTRNLALKERWWGPNDHWNMEIHVAPGIEDNVHITFSAAHWIIDGHLTLALDKFFDFLATELEGTAQPLDELKWGEETKRLPPSLAAAVAEKYHAQLEPVAEPPVIPSLFMRPVKFIPHTSGYTTVAFPLVLTQAETEAFHKACKVHNRNVTPVITSILLLSDVETTLWWGRQGGPEKFNVVKHMFDTTDYFIAINEMDRRLACLPEHIDLDAPLGTPGVACEGYPTFHDMDLIRKSIRLSEDGQLRSDMSVETFWNGVVADTARQYEVGRVISPTFLADQEVTTEEALTTRVLCSSIGNLDKLGRLVRWKPSTAVPKSPFVIDQLLLGIRTSTPTIACICYQYDGQLTLYLQGSARHNSKEAWQYYGEAVERRVRHLVDLGNRIA